MVDAGILVFAAFIAPYTKSREYVRKLMSGWPYYECFVKCPLEECIRRDPKGLYKKALGGEIDNMTGISAPYEEPESPDLNIDTLRYSLDECSDQLIRFLIDQRIVLAIGSRRTREEAHGS
jgi:adenylylsulfate kinase